MNEKKGGQPRRSEPLSLAPLSLEDALRGAMAVPPPPKKAKGKKKGRKKKGQ